MIQTYKFIYIILFISVLVSFSKIEAAEITEYSVKFGYSDHNYRKDNHVRIDVIFNSRSDKPIDVSQELIVLDINGKTVWNTRINIQLKPEQKFTVPFLVPVPRIPGKYTLTIPGDSRIGVEHIPSFNFVVIEPHKSEKLSMITVLAPEWEDGLTRFVDQWAIKASSISFGQAVLCGKKTWQRLVEDDGEAKQLIERALKRDMSVIFLDFGPVEIKEGGDFKIKLPYDVVVNFIKATSPEINFIPERSNKALIYDFPFKNFYSLNGIYGVCIPPVDMRFEGKDVDITNYANAGKKPYRSPVVELKPKSGKGKLILCQVITDGRLDETVKPPRNKPELPAYDPLAVQFILNLISASVGDELLNLGKVKK